MSESDENYGNIHATEHKEKPSRSGLCITFYLVLSISCFTLMIGGLWAIMDIIQPTGKWEWFKDLGIMLQIIIAGGFGIIGIGGVIVLWLLYPKGTRLIHKMLYPPITKEQFEKGTFLARFITAGLLISIFIIVVGFVLAFIEWIVAEGGVSFIGFLKSTPNGLLIMLFSSMLLVFTILVIVFVWVWINGYQKTLKLISDNNARIDRAQVKKLEWNSGVSFYIIVLISVLGVALGGAWYGMDIFVFPIDWTNFGTTFLVIGGLGSLVFLVLIGGLVLFSLGSYKISHMLFARKGKISEELDTQDKNLADSITVTLLIAIALLIIGAMGMLVDYLMKLAEEQSGGTFLEWLVTLPSYGIWTVLFSGMLFVGIWVMIFIIYVWTHGYFFFFNANARKVLRDNEKIERDKHNNAQVAFGVIIYVLIWLCVFGIIYGAIWWGMEEFSAQWTDSTTRISLKFLIIESMGSVFFLLLTGGLLFARRLVFFISKMLFVRREDIPDNVEKQDKVIAQIITITLLVAIALVAVGSFGLLVQFLINRSLALLGMENLIEIITFLPNGVLSMIASGLLLISIWILIFVIFVWTNGYYFFYIRFLRSIAKQ
ncbi:MAG: hypothetical protein JW776_01855 [Candidatus Lokiarchaeota archaeon]|nr:hypothetical protein [Candidatus Lokiarchaeota archaeon]